MASSGEPTGMAAQSTKAEVYPLFPEQVAGPFQSNSTEQSDLHFIRRFGPGSAPVDMTGVGRNWPGKSARSALSAPDNFIADSYFRRVVRHHFGKRRWPLVVLAGSALIGAAAAATVLGILPFEDAKSAFGLSEPAAVSAIPRNPVRTSKPAEL